MWGRLLGVLAGLALCGEAIVLWRPETIGALQNPDLGAFSPYRPILAGLAVLVGGVVIAASVLREPGKAKAKPALFSTAEPAEPELAIQPILHLVDAEPHPAPILASPAAQAQSDEPQALDPFPAEDIHAPAAAEPVIAASAPAAPAAAASGERGTFLSAMDAGDQMRAANRIDDALELYDGALALARRAHAAAPSDPAAQRDLAQALTSVGEIHDRQGRLDSALALHEESLNLRRNLAGQSPGDIAAQRALSAGLERLADTREARGHRSRARDLFRERLPIAERLASAAPGDPGLSQDLAATRERLQELDAALAP